MALLIIKSNPLTTSDVLIADMGLFIPGGGGFEDYEDLNAIRQFQRSRDLRTLVLDEFYGPDSSTLILNDGNGDIPLARIDEFLGSFFSSQDLPNRAVRDSQNSDLIYVGRTSQDPSITSSATWQIYRYSLQNATKSYAEGDQSFNKIWDHRESLNY